MCCSFELSFNELASNIAKFEVANASFVFLVELAEEKSQLPK